LLELDGLLKVRKMNASSSSTTVMSILGSQKLIVIIVLIAITILVYAPIRNHQFLRYDDDRYVTDDLRVRQGLTWENVIWSMTAFEVDHFFGVQVTGTFRYVEQTDQATQAGRMDEAPQSRECEKCGLWIGFV